jgi:cobalt transporter subunit CbtB
MNPSTSASSASLTLTPVTATASVLAQLAAALLLGLVMLYAVGFSEASVAHNAAHDVRHANGRPCH